VVKELLRLKPRRIGIVSCDPSTLARDLKGLCEAGYKIKSMALVDLFPQTYHMETVTHLEL
jgi:23S rRNA (uracil1939-C5)-methyltransferase